MYAEYDRDVTEANGGHAAFIIAVMFLVALGWTAALGGFDGPGAIDFIAVMSRSFGTALTA